MRTRVLGMIVLAGVGAGVWLWSEPPRELAAFGPGAYAVDYDFGLELSGLPGDDGQVKTALTGTLHLAESESGLRGRLQVDSLGTSAGAKRLGFLQAGAEQALAEVFTIDVAPKGEVTAVRLAEDLPLPVSSLLSAIITSSQYVRAANPEVEAWSSRERDANGNYSAKYKFTTGNAVEKKWTLGQSESLGGVRGRSHAMFALDGPWVQSVTVRQEGSAMAGGADSPRSPFSLDLKLQRIGSADEGYINRGPEKPLRAFTSKTGVPKNIRVAGPEPRPLEQLMATLSQVTEKDTLKQATELRSELTEAVIRDNKVADALDGLLRVPDVPVFQARYAVEALLGARTHYADALAAALLLDATVSGTARTMLMAGAALLDKPKPKVVHAVRKVMKTAEPAEKSRAAMALSGIAVHLKQSEEFRLGRLKVPGTVRPGEEVLPDEPVVPEDPREDQGEDDSDDPRETETKDEGDPPTYAVDPDDEGLPASSELEAEIIAEARFILEELPSASFGWKAAMIRALGNLGTEECLPLVRIGLEDDNLLVRAAAATALRYQDPGTVGDDLSKALNDYELEVRAAAVKAARKMGPAATKDLVQNTLFFDKSEYVRLEAVYTFGAWSHEAPVVINVLAQAAEQEKSPKVMQAIRQMQNKNRVEPPFMMDPLPQEGQ